MVVGDGGCAVVVDVVPGDCVVVVDVGAGGLVVVFDVAGAVVVVVPRVVSGSAPVMVVVVVVVDSTNSGSSLITCGVVVVVISVGVVTARALVVGISIVGWMTRLRTWETAPQENTTAMRAARAQPAASFVQFGMTRVSQAGS